MQKKVCVYVLPEFSLPHNVQRQSVLKSDLQSPAPSDRSVSEEQPVPCAGHSEQHSELFLGSCISDQCSRPCPKYDISHRIVLLFCLHVTSLNPSLYVSHSTYHCFVMYSRYR
jgi:hypothetical protein